MTKTLPKPKPDSGTQAVWPAKEPTRQKVNMLFDSALLARLDESAKRRGVTRTAWVHWAVGELLDTKKKE